MISPEILRRLNTDNFKNTELIEFCHHCLWQVFEAQDDIYGKCPDCATFTTFARFDEEFRHNTGIKIVKKYGTPKTSPKAKA
jgi:hypothetical protein